MKNVSLYEVAWELFRLGIKPKDIAKRLGIGRATVYRWLKSIKYRGIRRFVKEKKEARRKRKRRYLDTRVVFKIKKIRQETGWCGEKIVWELKNKHGVKVSQSSVYRVLNRYFSSEVSGRRTKLEDLNRKPSNQDHQTKRGDPG